MRKAKPAPQLAPPQHSTTTLALSTVTLIDPGLFLLVARVIAPLRHDSPVPPVPAIVHSITNPGAQLAQCDRVVSGGVKPLVLGGSL